MAGRVANRHFSRAFRWQRRFVAIIGALFLWVAFAVVDFRFAYSDVCGFGFLVIFASAGMATIAICYHVYSGSVSRRGAFYAIVHAMLVILLTPLGVFVIPVLANGDIIRLRDWEREHPEGGHQPRS